MIVRTGMTKFRVVCEACVNHLTLQGKYVADSDTALRADAQAHGWTADGDVDCCPHHTPNR